MMIGSSDETVRVDLHLHSRAAFEILRNGVDADLFTPRKREPDPREFLGVNKTLLLYVGRVSKEKGLERLLHRYLDLRSRRQDVHLVVVGDGPYREEMESALGSYPPGGLSPNFRFTAFSKVRTGWR